jgi:arsenate reductase (thioredoxin)
VDISSHRSKHISELTGIPFDAVITVCNRARETCPYIPRALRVLHAGFDDPPVLAVGAKTEEEAMVHYRRVRDDIRAFVETLPKVMEKI